MLSESLSVSDWLNPDEMNSKLDRQAELHQITPLCKLDTRRTDWSINQPVKLMSDTLMCWTIWTPKNH